MIVDLLPTEDQEAFRDSVSALLAGELPIARLHEEAAFGGAAERAIWGTLAELGLFGLSVCEERGGFGCTLAEEVTVAREFGKYLVSPTVLSTMLATHVAGDDILPGIVAGETRVAFANPLQPVDFSNATADVQLIDAQGADYVLLWNAQEARLYRAPADARSAQCLDDTVGLARTVLDLGSAVARREGPGMLRAASLMLAAALAGNAEATCMMAVEYGKLREQFGQPIGSFQSIKHYCAEMARRAEAAVAQTLFATLDALEREDGNLFEVAAARLLAGDAARENGRFNIQIHGGIGFTYEADAHLFLKRAWLLSGLGSSERIEQARIIAADGPAA
jgi:alkylation response protein AidB-like acyl-CoA dehydrogenase